MNESEKTDTKPAPSKLGLLKRLPLPGVRSTANFAIGVLICYLAIKLLGSNEEPTSQREPAHQTPRTVEASAPAKVPDRDTLATTMEHGDEFLSVNDVMTASSVYDRLAVESGVQGNSPLMYRQALCSEYTGDWKKGLARYQQIIDNASEYDMVILARFGVARIWFNNGKPENAKRLIWSILMLPNLTEDVMGYAMHLLAQMSLADAFDYESDLLNRGIFPPEIATLPSYLVRLSNIPIKKSDATPAASLTVLDRLSAEPNDIHISVAIPMSPLQQVLQIIADQASLQLKWSTAALTSGQNRNVQMFAKDIDLATALDAVLEPLGLVWTAMPRGIQIRLEREVQPGVLRKARRQQAARIAQTAFTVFSDQPLAPESLLCLGNIEYLSGRFEDAAIHFEDITRRYDEAPAARRAWINLAQAKLQSDSPADARQALYRVVDESEYKSVEAVAYFLLGRLDIEIDDPSTAVKHLGRAVALAQDDKLRAESAVLLSCAQLMGNNPHAGNSTLVSQRDQLRESPYLEQTVFLSSLARFRSASTQKAQLRPGRTLTAALAHVVPESFSSCAGYFLVGEAFHEIGFSNQMEQVYKDALTKVEKNDLRDRMQYRLAEYHRENNNFKEARAHFEPLALDETSAWSRQAALKIAEIELDEHKPVDCLRRCWELLSSSTEVSEKKDLLRLMGRVYEQQSDHYKAALCFAGMVPTSNATIDALGIEE